MFNDQLINIVNSSKECVSCPIILVSHDPSDYEPILISLPRYLKYNNINNPLMVKNSMIINEKNPLTNWIYSEIDNIQTKGGLGFTPLTENAYGKCYIVDFSGTTDDSKCKNLGKIWRLGDYPY
jgi:hypothetical protein